MKIDRELALLVHGTRIWWEVELLTEAEVRRSFAQLFKNQDVSDETFERAEALLEELRPESPLRHRLSRELSELRKLTAGKS